MDDANFAIPSAFINAFVHDQQRTIIDDEESTNNLSYAALHNIPSSNYNLMPQLEHQPPELTLKLPPFSYKSVQLQSINQNIEINESPRVVIIEEPKSRGFRFRYRCEGRCAGSILGENSTPEKKSYPTIKICNFKGAAVVVVSCVTKEDPAKPHPHSLVGKDCKKGVCTVKSLVSDTISFPNLGIQCVKKKEVADALKIRREINVDPFKTGFDHAKDLNIDFSIIRLCFQTFIQDDQGLFKIPLNPVVSQQIIDKKAQNDLSINRMDKCSGKSCGRDEVFLLCEKVSKDDIKIRFFENDSEGNCIWQEYGDFGHTDVHRQYAIVFKTPPYKNQLITKAVTVCLQLLRPSDNACSESVMFTYQPEDPDPDRIEEKRKRKANLRMGKHAADSQHIDKAELKNRLRLRAVRGTKEGVQPYSYDNIVKAENPGPSTCNLPFSVVPDPPIDVPVNPPNDLYQLNHPFDPELNMHGLSSCNPLTSDALMISQSEQIGLMSDETFQQCIQDINSSHFFSDLPLSESLGFS